MVRRPLTRYFDILKGKERANYLIAKDTRLDVDLLGSTELLWDKHDSEAPEADAGQCSAMDLKVELARRVLEACSLCERKCGADRRSGQSGWCGVLEPRIASDFIHMGEEPDLVPSYTVFFSGCTFDCVYCQNHDISRRPCSGEARTFSEMAERIDSIAAPGSIVGRARNVNWVGGDPTPNLGYVLETMSRCTANAPHIWNSNMYMSTEALKLLDGVIDVYLADFKYGNDECAKRLSDAPDYMQVATRNHLIARSHAEMVIRHLVLPGHLDCCTRPVLEWIAGNLEGVVVNVMAQYRPEHRAMEFAELSRPLRADEHRKAMTIADDLGLTICV